MIAETSGLPKKASIQLADRIFLHDEKIEIISVGRLFKRIVCNGQSGCFRIVIYGSAVSFYFNTSAPSGNIYIFTSVYQESSGRNIRKIGSFSESG